MQGIVPCCCTSTHCGVPGKDLTCSIHFHRPAQPGPIPAVDCDIGPVTLLFTPDADTVIHPSTWQNAPIVECAAGRQNLTVTLACEGGAAPSLYLDLAGLFPTSCTATITTFTTGPLLIIGSCSMAGGDLYTATITE
jgi:hypothetical protein